MRSAKTGRRPGADASAKRARIENYCGTRDVEGSEALPTAEQLQPLSGYARFLAADIARYEKFHNRIDSGVCARAAQRESARVVYGLPGSRIWARGGDSERNRGPSEHGEAVNADAECGKRRQSQGCRRVAPAGAGKIQTFEWVTVLTARAGIAAGGREPGVARGEWSQPRGSPGACEHDGADAAQARQPICAADRGSPRDLGATLNSGAGTDTTGVSTRSLSRNFPDALDCWPTSRCIPAFRSRIERVTSERLSRNA